MEALLPIIIQVVTGALGGGAAASALKDANMGGLGNMLTGAIGGLGGGMLGGGAIGGLLGAATGDAASGLDIGALAGDAVGGGVGGAILTGVVGMIKNKMAG